MGDLIAIIGAFVVVIATCTAASAGIMWVQKAAAGVISEEPEKYGKLFALQLVPSSSALYGFVVGIVVLMNTVMSSGGGSYVPYTVTQGILVLLACLPMAIVGSMQTLFQARVCVSCVNMVSKNGELSGRALIMAVFSEIFALFALVVSIMSVFYI